MILMLTMQLKISRGERYRNRGAVFNETNTNQAVEEK